MASSPLPVVQVLEHFGVRARVEGGQANMRCPFHDEQEGSLDIDMAVGYWNCFGCGRNGSFVDFVAAMQGKGALNAMMLIRKLAGAQRSPARGSVVVIDDERERRGAVCNPEVAWRRFHPVSWDSIALDHPVARYMIRKRGFERSTLAAFDVRLTESAEYPVAFQIARDGKLLGYARRRIDGVEKQKYMYNAGFDGKHALAYHRVGRGPLLVVEGVLDYMKAVQFGCAHAAAILSWRITDAQARWLVGRGIREAVSALDNTPTGEEGTARLRERFGAVYRFKYPGSHKKDVADLDIAQFWMGWPL